MSNIIATIKKNLTVLLGVKIPWDVLEKTKISIAAIDETIGKPEAKKLYQIAAQIRWIRKHIPKTSLRASHAANDAKKAIEAAYKCLVAREAA